MLKRWLVLTGTLLLVPAGASATGAGASPKFETVVTGERARSPARTQDRVFAGTRFWRLDPGTYEVEVWVDDPFKRSGEQDGLLKLEVEIGLAPHLQVDLYQNFSFGTGKVEVQGNQLELRYAFGSAYDSVPLNPVLYLEWAPRKAAQDRAEVRLLLGQDASPRLLWAANLFVESNVDYFKAAGAEGFDAEAGVTAAGSYCLIEDVLRLGAEGRFGADQHGELAFAPSAMLGPSLLLTARPSRLKLTVTALVGLLERDPRVRLLVVGGWAF